MNEYLPLALVSSVELDPRGYQLGQQVFIPPNLSIAEVKQSHIQLFLNRPAHFLLPELIVKLMR
jgi:hypothetical protein